MNEKETRALREVLTYLAEEKDDYALFVERGGNPDNHIYARIQTLEDYVRGLYSTGNIKLTQGESK
jgi:hypothetical protein